MHTRPAVYLNTYILSSHSRFANDVEFKTVRKMKKKMCWKRFLSIIYSKKRNKKINFILRIHTLL